MRRKCAQKRSMQILERLSWHTKPVVARNSSFMIYLTVDLLRRKVDEA
jgi:hypothetical protein